MKKEKENDLENSKNLTITEEPITEEPITENKCDDCPENKCDDCPKNECEGCPVANEDCSMEPEPEPEDFQNTVDESVKSSLDDVDPWLKNKTEKTD